MAYFMKNHVSSLAKFIVHVFGNFPPANYRKSIILSDLTHDLTCEFIYLNILETDSDLQAHGTGVCLSLILLYLFVYSLPMSL